LAPVAVVLVYLPVALDILGRIDTDKPYDATAATVVLLELAWVVLAALEAWRIRALLKSLRWYRREEQSWQRTRDDMRAERHAREAEAARTAVEDARSPDGSET
jgi:hypothetical protein